MVKNYGQRSFFLLLFQAKNKIVMLKVLRDIRSRGGFRPINDAHNKHPETSGLLSGVS